MAVLTPSAAIAAKGDEPTGQSAILDLDGDRAVDVAALNAGEMVVVATAGTYYGILRRTDAQIEAARASDGGNDPVADADRVLNPDYLVLDMACPHRACQVGYTGEAEDTFVCPCHRSTFDASGRVTKRPARENLAIPAYEISGTVGNFSLRGFAKPHAAQRAIAV